MRRISFLLAIFAIGGFSLAVSGCAEPEPEGSTNLSTTDADHDHAHDHEHGDHAHDHEHGDHEHADADEDATEAEQIEAALAKLSAEDRPLAEAQAVCVVSDEKLGSMGVPQKVAINGKEVWICCAGCKDSLLENPDEYLAKLDDAQPENE
jgi:Cu(I)/Ag(I) efflux system membrane fusion protein